MRLRDGVLVLCSLLLLVGTVHAQATPPNVKINSVSTNLQNEEQIWINLTDSMNVVADWRDFRFGFRQVGVGRSTNGGATWTDQINFATPYPWESDPCLVGSQSGTFYLNLLNFDPAVPIGGGSSLINVYRSTNGGVTWVGPVAASPEGPHFEDKQFTAVDRTGGPYHGNYYVSWTRFDNPTRIIFARSTNGAQTFDDTITVGPVVSTSACGGGIDQGQFSIPIVNSDGSVHVFWQGRHFDSGSCISTVAIRHSYSTDGGATFAKDSMAFLSNFAYAYVNGGIDVYGMPNGDADISGGPYDGTIYISQTQSSQFADGGFVECTDVTVRKSTDNGMTWSDTSRVNDDSADGFSNCADQFHPWLAVNEDGVVVVIFYDRRDDLSNWLFNCYFSASFDGGETFITNYRLSSVASSPADLSSIAQSAPMLMEDADADPGPHPTPAWLMNPMAGLIAEYIGVHAKHDYVVAVWTDTRDGTQDVYSARFTIPFMKPRLYLPEDGSQTPSTTPSFTWSTCWHEDQDSYRLELSTDPGFGSIDYAFTGITDNSYSPGSPLLGNNYYWRVKAFRTAGDSTDYSEAFLLEVGCEPGTPPALNSPATDDTLREQTVILDWGDVAGALSYDLQVSTAADFSTLFLDTTSFLSDFTVGGLADSTLHYWRVKSLNSCGAGPWSTSQFYVETCPIDMTGDVNESGVINSSDVIWLVNYTFKGGPAPLPVAQAGDVNCDGGVNSADIIYMVNYVFKSGPDPCDACTTL